MRPMEYNPPKVELLPFFESQLGSLGGKGSHVETTG